MDDKDILKKIIKKVFDNLSSDEYLEFDGFKATSLNNLDYSYYNNSVTLCLGSYEYEEDYYIEETKIIGLKDLIFRHDFAKALWGDEKKCMICGESKWKDQYDCNCTTCSTPYEDSYQFGYKTVLLAWQYHLQQIVLEENPIKYLEEFI